MANNSNVQNENVSLYKGDRALGRLIRKLRIALGYSQVILAEALGVSDSTISNWELGRSDIGYNELKHLANVLQVDFDVLLHPEQEVNPKEIIQSKTDAEILIAGLQHLGKLGEDIISAGARMVDKLMHDKGIIIR